MPKKHVNCASKLHLREFLSTDEHPVPVHHVFIGTKFGRKTGKRSRPTHNCHGVVYVGDFELVGERLPEQPPYTCSHNPYMNDSILEHFLSSRNNLFRHPKVFIQIHRRQRPQNDLRKFKKVPPGHLRPTVLNLYEHVFPELSIVATMASMSGSTSVQTAVDHSMHGKSLKK